MELNRGLRSQMPIPGNQNFPKKSGKFPIPSIQEEDVPGTNSVPAFVTQSKFTTIITRSMLTISLVVFTDKFKERFSGKSLKIRYYSRLYRTVLSSPVPSRSFPKLFPRFTRTTGPEKSSLITVLSFGKCLPVWPCLVSKKKLGNSDL